jgi:hypothetical protein
MDHQENGTPRDPGSGSQGRWDFYSPFQRSSASRAGRAIVTFEPGGAPGVAHALARIDVNRV